MTGTLAQRLGYRAAGIDIATAGQQVRDRLVEVVTQVLSAALLGAGRPDVAAIRQGLLFGGGPSTVIGYPDGAAPALAALANALPVAAEQRQDGHRVARGHPGSHVVPAVLAVAEAQASTGPSTCSALLAGYEMGAALGLAQGGTPPGVHDIATWGVPAAAAGVAHLLSGGDAHVVTAALELAASVPVLGCADMVFTGASGQHLLLGVGAQLGVIWGQAAAAGLRAVPGTLESHYARFTAPDWDPGAIDAAPGWALLEGYLKRHPTCAHLHGVNDAVEDLVAAGPMAADSVAQVEVRIYAAASAFDEAVPRNELSARFSIPWTVATGLVYGDLSDRCFAAETLADERLRSLARRVQVRADPGLEAGYPAGRPSTVVVHRTDGSVLTAHADRPRGDGPTALSVPDVRSGPRDRLTPLIGTDATDRLLTAVARLDRDGPAPVAAALRDASTRTVVAGPDSDSNTVADAVHPCPR